VEVKKMIEGCRDSAFVGASNWLHFAATPTFAIMALLSAVDGGPTDMFCSTMHGGSPLTGMVAMYVLMSIFHSRPWLKLISSWRNRRAHGRSYD
jgi:hypothetical protein